MKIILLITAKLYVFITYRVFLCGRKCPDTTGETVYIAHLSTDKFKWSKIVKTTSTLPYVVTKCILLFIVEDAARIIATEV